LVNVCSIACERRMHVAAVLAMIGAGFVRHNQVGAGCE
jgi:hypothetical protein